LNGGFAPDGFCIEIRRYCYVIMLHIPPGSFCTNASTECILVCELSVPMQRLAECRRDKAQETWNKKQEMFFHFGDLHFGLSLA
jgi:hypothetical protein